MKKYGYWYQADSIQEAVTRCELERDLEALGKRRPARLMARVETYLDIVHRYQAWEKEIEQLKTQKDPSPSDLFLVMQALLKLIENPGLRDVFPRSCLLRVMETYGIERFFADTGNFCVELRRRCLQIQPFFASAVATAEVERGRFQELSEVIQRCEPGLAFGFYTAIPDVILPVVAGNPFKQSVGTVRVPFRRSSLSAHECEDPEFWYVLYNVLFERYHANWEDASLPKQFREEMRLFRQANREITKVEMRADLAFLIEDRAEASRNLIEVERAYAAIPSDAFARRFASRPSVEFARQALFMRLLRAHVRLHPEETLSWLQELQSFDYKKSFTLGDAQIRLDTGLAFLDHARGSTQRVGR